MSNLLHSDSWRPLLTGRAREQALLVLDDITAALSERAEESTGPGVAGGQAGLAIYFAYLHRLRARDEDIERAGTLLDSAGEALSATDLPPGLYSGFSGVAWATQLLGSELFESEDEEDPLAEIDHALSLVLAGRRPFHGEYDLINGWVGIGVYAIDRLHRPSARALLTRILELLESTAERTKQGVTWKHPVALLPEWQRPTYPDGWYNVGLAHGMPGVIGLLAEMCLAGIEVERSERLLRDSVEWLLSKRQAQDPVSDFPSNLKDAAEQGGTSRNAWCYGDPGVASALFLAGRALNERAWETIAVEVMLSVATRTIARDQSRDVPLCHGSAGLAHIFNRFYQATRNEAFAQATRDWFDRVLFEQRQPGKGVAGYPSYQPGLPEEQRTDPWRSEPGLLMGAAGIGLALISAIAPVEPRWDHMLLVSLPVAREALQPPA